MDVSRSTRIGIMTGLAAYGLWGLIPLYFKLLEGVSPFAVVGHRVIWSMLLLGIALWWMGAMPKLRAALADQKTRRTLFLSAFLIALNWVVYVYGIVSDRVLATSLGYYLNPIANILMGRFILGEKLGRLQWAAVAIAALGISALLKGALDSLWITLTLCVSFATYGLLRKQVKTDSVTGLTVETLILFPIALIGIALASLMAPTPTVHGQGIQIWLLVASGLVSTVPLLLFTESARRLRYSTVGMLQFLAPTLQFLLAIFLFREPFGEAKAIAFACIWTAIALYVAGLVMERRSRESEA